MPLCFPITVAETRTVTCTCTVVRQSEYTSESHRLQRASSMEALRHMQHDGDEGLLLLPITVLAVVTGLTIQKT